jgi:hypothetical protein
MIKIIKFINESYPIKLRKLIYSFFVIFFILGLIMTVDENSHQKSIINQQITELKIQIKQKQQEEIQKNQLSLLQPETIYGFDPKQNRQQRARERYLNQTEEGLFSNNYELTMLENNKKHLELGYYYIYNFFIFFVIFIAIPLIRVIILSSKFLFRKSRIKISTIYLELTQMTSFQKYSLILSTLVLIVLTTLILILLK